MIQLTLALLTWLALAGSILAPSQSVAWYLPVVAFAVWRLCRPRRKVLLAGLILPILVLILGTSQLHLNPVLARVADSFQSKQLRLKVIPLHGNTYSAQILWPASLQGSGIFIAPASTRTPTCSSQVWSGNFWLTPPRQIASADNQFVARPQSDALIVCDGGVQGFIEQLGARARHQVRSDIAGVSTEAKGLVLGITDGDTSLIPQGLLDSFKELSLTHLNAVSGTNCSIVIALLIGALTRLGAGRRVRVVAGLSGLVLYLILVGNQPSVLRAAAMAVVVLFALVGGRRVTARSALALVILLLLFWQPQFAVNYGFALSVFATLGVLELAPRLARVFGKGLPAWLALPFSVAISAQIACLPVLVLLQPTQSVMAVLANVFAEPVVPVITVLGVIAAGLASLSLVLLAGPIFLLASLPAQYLVWLANTLSGLGTSVTLPSGWLGVCLSLLLVAVAFGVTLKNRIVRVASVSVLSVVLVFSIIGVTVKGFQVRNFAAGDWFYVACDVGQGDATVIRSSGHIALVDVGRDPQPVDKCLKRLGVTHIDLLVLTHFDMDHVGGVSGAITGRRVDRALFTSFVDDRPGADATRKTVEQAGIPVQSAEQGLSGKLGDFSWLVLSPHHLGADSEDSNDGSVTMYWVSARVRILTLADLPAKGQMRLAQERAQWFEPKYANFPLVLKVSHHGSADQYPEFIEWLHPVVATVSVGANNSYGHPTAFTLNLLQQAAGLTLRTDQQGSISLQFDGAGKLGWGSSGGG